MAGSPAKEAASAAPEAAVIESTPANKNTTDAVKEAVPPVFTMAGMKLLSLKDEVDAQDKGDGRWAAGKVVALEDGGVKISYAGFASKYDASYAWADAGCLAPPWSRVWKGIKNPATKKKKKAKDTRPTKKAKKATVEEPAEEPTEADLEEKIWVESPEGEAYELEGTMTAFCKENELNANAMSQLLKENVVGGGDGEEKVMKAHKGWKCWRADRKTASVVEAKMKNRSTLTDIHERIQNQHEMGSHLEDGYKMTTVKYQVGARERAFYLKLS